MALGTTQSMLGNGIARGLDVPLLGIGLGLSSATQLRLSAFSFGVGEVFLLCGVGFSLLHLVLSRRIAISQPGKPMAAAWVVVILALLSGWLLSLLAGNWNSISGPHDAMAYGFSLLVITSILVRPSLTLRTEAIVKIMIYVSVGGLGLILILSLLFPGASFLGITPWSGIRFVGWAANPNQIAFAVGGVPFIAYYFRVKATLKLQRWTATGILILSVVVGLATLSDAMIAGWLAAATSMLLLWLLGHEKQRLFSASVLVRLLFAAVIILGTVVVLYSTIQSTVDNLLMAENSQASVRFLLWKNGLLAFMDSPIFGHGPGAYSWTLDRLALTEAHNTFIDFAASAGLVGLSALLFLIILGVYRTFQARDAGLLGCITYLTVFSMFHFMLRHPLFWVILLFVMLSPQGTLWYSPGRTFGPARGQSRFRSRTLTE